MKKNNLAAALDMIGFLLLNGCSFQLDHVHDEYLVLTDEHNNYELTYYGELKYDFDWKLDNVFGEHDDIEADTEQIKKFMLEKYFKK